MAEEELAVEESEFEEAFAEIATAKEVDSEDPDISRPADDPAAAVAAKDKDDGTKDGAVAEGEDKPTGDKPVDKPAESAEEDPYAGMDDATKEKFVAIESQKEKLQHQLDSNSGRVRAFQQKVTGLETEIQTIRKGGGAQPSPTQIADAMKGSDEGWDQFTEDYPAVASAIDKRLERAGVATQESIDNTLAPVIERQVQAVQNDSQAANQAASNAVAEVYPTWTEAVQTKDFVDWLSDQSPGVNGLAESDDAKDASMLIGLYDDHLVSNGKESLKAVHTEPVGEGAKPDGANEISELAKKRALQVEAGATVESKSTRVDVSESADTEFEAAFEVFAKKRESRRRTA